MNRVEKAARRQAKIEAYKVKMKSMSILELVDGIERLKKRNPGDLGLILIAEREFYGEVKANNSALESKLRG